LAYVVAFRNPHFHIQCKRHDAVSIIIINPTQPTFGLSNTLYLSVLLTVASF